MKDGRGTGYIDAGQALKAMARSRFGVVEEQAALDEVNRKACHEARSGHAMKLEDPALGREHAQAERRGRWMRCLCHAVSPTETDKHLNAKRWA
jgi:hypothetical protein